jgi:diaminopimelate decarboxylase
MNKDFKDLLDQMEHPFFLYDLDYLKKHLKKIKKSSPDFLKIWFACKANPLKFILEELREQNFGIDVASQGELDQARYVGYPGDSIIATGPAKSKKYLRYLLQCDVSLIVLESLNQAIWLNEEAKKINRKVDVLVRFQLDWSKVKDQTSVLGGSSITPFGLSPEDWKKCRASDFDYLNVIGTHIFQWGNMLDYQELISIWDHCIEQSLRLSEELKFDLKIIDLGGGIGLDYQEPSFQFDFKHICQELGKLKIKHKVPQIWMELGRYAVGESGSYFTQIVDIKTVRNQKIIVVEGGINQLARPALTGESFPCVPLLENPSSEFETYHVHGPLCTALDKLGVYSLPKNIAVHDWIRFNLCGAYGFTESMPFFLGHSLPGEVIKRNDQFKIVRHPESARSYLKL